MILTTVIYIRFVGVLETTIARRDPRIVLDWLVGFAYFGGLYE